MSPDAAGSGRLRMARQLSTLEAIEAKRAEIEQSTVQMRTQVAAFRRTAGPEIKSSYLRIAAEIGREEPFVTGRLGPDGVQELIEEVELVAWDVPHALDEIFQESWIQACFAANASWPDDPGALVYDYLRGRSSTTESPFPAYFLRELHGVFRPLGRLLQRAGYRVSRDARERTVDDSDPANAYHRVISRYRMNPALVRGASLFGEHARTCYELREQLDLLVYTSIRENAQQVWDEAEAARKRAR